MAYTEKNYVSEVQAPRTSPFDALASAIVHLEKARSVAGELASSLVGQVPSAVSGKDGSANGGGLIDQIERYAASINSLAASIIEDMDRVQRRL